MSSRFHVRRSNVSEKETLVQYNGIRSTRWVRPNNGNSVREVQTTHRPQDLQKIAADVNYLTPPYHWHWYQEENFYVMKG